MSSNTSGLSIAGLAEARSEDFRQALARHAFLQPTAVPDAARNHPDERYRSCCGGGRQGIRRPPARQERRRLRKTHRASSPITSPCTVSSAFSRRSRAVSTRLRKSTRSRAPQSGVQRARRFRTVDIAGLDILVHVAADLASRLPHDRSVQFQFPAFVGEMVKRGWIGEKAGRGFYERRKSASGESEIWALDPQKMEYRPRQSVKLPSLEAAASLSLARKDAQALHGERSGRRVSAEHAARRRSDTRQKWLRRSPTRSMTSTGRCDGAIGWPLGPFELADAIGLDGKTFRTVATGPPLIPSSSFIRTARDRKRVIASNAGASLVDLEDGVLAVSLHSKMNAIGGDALEMLQRGVREASQNFSALVVTAEGPNFSVGANLMLLLLEAQEGNWEEIDAIVRAFQTSDDRPALCGSSGRHRPVRSDAGRWLRDRPAR